VLILLLSTYDLGRQPFGLASPAAWLRDAGFEVVCVDLTRQPLPVEAAGRAGLVALHLPMHTATRLAIPVIERVRTLNPGVPLCAYGLYAPLNRSLLGARGVEVVTEPEFERDLVALARRLQAGEVGPSAVAAPGASPARLRFKVPDRSGLPPLSRYAALRSGDGDSRPAGYTEASRGCRHVCRHCPIVPVYSGHFRVVAADVVLADIGTQVAAGARHVTFGDPDFFNGPRHAQTIARAVAREFPGLTYDVTIKIEHLLRHQSLLPVLRDTGCILVTSAAEAVDDRVLARLEKGHTRADFVRAVEVCRETGLTLSPTFVPFTPWTTREGYLDLLRLLVDLDLVEQVAPIQLAIRLLVTEGSRLRELPELREVLHPFDPTALVYPWQHADPEVDRLQADLFRIVAEDAQAGRRTTFERIWRRAHESARVPDAPVPAGPLPARASVPYLDEPWYC
jgi:radical SAM superfamily enzyme YgiQ (UPF0313 family)